MPQKENKTNLFDLVRFGNIDGLRKAIADSADTSVREEGSNDTLLHVAVRLAEAKNKNGVEIAQLLIRNGSDLYAKNTEGQHPRELASKEIMFKIFGAEVKEASDDELAVEGEKNIFDETEIFWAVQRDQPARVEELIKFAEDQEAAMAYLASLNLEERPAIEAYCTLYKQGVIDLSGEDCAPAGDPE